MSHLSPNYSKPKKIAYVTNGCRKIHLHPDAAQPYRIWCALGGTTRNFQSKTQPYFQLFKQENNHYWFSDFLMISQILLHGNTDKHTTLLFSQYADNFIIRSAWEEVIELIGQPDVNHYYLFSQLKKHAPKFIQHNLFNKKNATIEDFCNIAKISKSKYEKHKTNFDKKQRAKKPLGSVKIV